MDEKIILVDEGANPIGIAKKLDSHHSNTPLHLAFSCYIFNNNNQLLITQRAKSKKVWPGVWTNSVCGHPAPEEKMIDAIKRRIDYELGMSAENFKLIVPDYRYKTPPFNGIIENEICPVYVATAKSQPRPNKEEVENYDWINWEEYTNKLNKDKNNKFSWWCKDQLKHLKNNSEFLTYSNL